MSARPRLAGFELAALLLLAIAAELALNRLAVPTLRPAGTTPPPLWHRALDHAALFIHYFAALLAAGAILHALVAAARHRSSRGAVAQAALLAAGAAFAIVALTSVAVAPGERLSLVFELTFAAVLLVILLGQLRIRGDLGAGLGIALVIGPLLLHCYGAVALHLFLDDTDLEWLAFPERLRAVGQWSAVAVAILSPYCFAPRPIAAQMRPAPFAVAAVVGALSAAFLLFQYEACFELARLGLGFDIGPAAPLEHVAVYVIALATLAWTLAACFLADAPARREIGLGLALIVLAGYSFAWPLQYLVAVVGLLVLDDAAAQTAAQERGARRQVRAPPIAEDVWQGYVRALLDSLRARHRSEPGRPRGGAADRGADDPADGDDPPADAERGAPVSAATIRAADDASTTYVTTRRDSIPLILRVDRVGQSIVGVDLLAGQEPPEGQAPAWTLQTRPARVLAGIHPAAPATEAPAWRPDDPAFARRFRVRDAGGLTDLLFDDGLRARATALVDGWMALWPGHGLRLRVFPGNGAPLDHPIPITTLASGSAPAPVVAVERLVALIDLVLALARRGLDAGAETPESRAACAP